MELAHAFVAEANSAVGGRRLCVAPTPHEGIVSGDVVGGPGEVDAHPVCDGDALALRLHGVELRRRGRDEEAEPLLHAQQETVGGLLCRAWLRIEPVSGVQAAHGDEAGGLEVVVLERYG